jgi:hypothetical protein
MTYQEYREKRQKEFDALPIFYAYSNKQLEEELAVRGLTMNDLKQVGRIKGIGGFFLLKDRPIIAEYFNKPDELVELMKDTEFAVQAFLYEMDNHEYAINYYQGDYDVCSCFCKCEWSEYKTYTDYLEEANHKEWIVPYEVAQRKHMKKAKNW